MNIAEMKAKLDRMDSGAYCYQYQMSAMFGIALELMASENGKKLIAERFSHDDQTIEDAVKSFMQLTYMAYLLDDREQAEKDAEDYFERNFRAK